MHAVRLAGGRRKLWRYIFIFLEIFKPSVDLKTFMLTELPAPGDVPSVKTISKQNTTDMAAFRIANLLSPRQSALGLTSIRSV
jgi:hypothetical protein